MYRNHSRQCRRAEIAIPVTGMQNSRPGGPASQAQLTWLSLPIKQRVRAYEPVIMQRLHDRYTGLFTRIVNRGRKQWEEVVNVYYLRRKSPNCFPDLCPGGKRVNAVGCRLDLRPCSGDRAVIDRQKLDIVSFCNQQAFLLLDDSIFATGLLIQIVEKEYLHEKTPILG